MNEDQSRSSVRDRSARDELARTFRALGAYGLANLVEFGGLPIRKARALIAKRKETGRSWNSIRRAIKRQSTRPDLIPDSE